METSEETVRRMAASEPAIDFAQPLRGVVLCCTAISPEKRSELSLKAEQMGAQHIYDLTSQVTHLIVGEYDTPKYRYVARERSDIKVILPSFIDELSERWKADQRFDFAQLQQEHMRLALADLKISLTGFECIEERQQIADDIIQNGGLYSGDLTKQTTHLIALRPEGQKYKYAKTWGKHIVSLEWLRQSIERGMILEESLFALDIPTAEQGKGAWNRCQPPKSPLGKRSRDPISNGEEGKRKIRRTLSTRINSQQGQIWGDIVGGSAATTPVLNGGQWEAASDAPANGVLQVARSMVIQPQQHLATQRIADIQPMFELAQGGALDGCRVAIHGFSPRHENVLRKHIISHDAEVVASLNELAAGSAMRRFIIVPHSMPRQELPRLPCEHAQLVTEFWVERCLEAKIFLDPETYRLGRPFTEYPLPGFENLKVCSTGLSGVQILHISKVISLLGAKYEENFSPEHSVLIFSPDRPIRPEKLKFAQTWGVPLVSVEWFYESVRLGTRQPYKPYLYSEYGHQSRKKAADKVRPQSRGGTRSGRTISEFTKDEAPTRDNKFRVPSRIDKSAFEPETTTAVPEVPRSSSTEKGDKAPPRLFAEPLSEISPNSPRKQPPSPDKTASASITEQFPKKDISNAISSLLASAKTTFTPNAETTEVPVKRKQSRILGRAASNVSAVSARDSRASSVDSTASNGRAVDWASGAGLKNSISADRPPRATNVVYLPEESTATDEGTEGGDGSAQPRSTQIGYLDSESTDHRDKVLAKLTGEKVAQKKHLNKVATVANLDSGGGAGGRKRNLRSR